MFTIETETGFTVATDTADEFDHALAALDRLTIHDSADAPQPAPCTCDADRPRELGDLLGSAELNEIYAIPPSYYVAKQQTPSYSANAPQGSGDPQPSQQVDPEEMLANTIEQRDHVKADREVMYLRERLATANGTVEGLRGNLREQATQLGRVMEEREKVSILCNEFVDLAKRHGWSPDSGKMPVEQISEWLDIFVKSSNECKALREQLARAAAINLGLEDKLAGLGYKRKGKGKVQSGD